MIQCPSRDNVKVSIDLALVFRIFDPHLFVVRLGPEKLDDMLKAYLEEVVRGLARAHLAEQMYNLSGHLTTEIVTGLNDNLREFGVEVKVRRAPSACSRL